MMMTMMMITPANDNDDNAAKDTLLVRGTREHDDNEIVTNDTDSGSLTMMTEAF